MTLLGVLVRFVQLGAALGLIGIFTMLLLAGRSDRATALAWEARVLSLMRWLVVALLFSGVVALAYQAAVATGRAGALLEPATWLRVMLETQFGTVWMIRHGLLLLLAGLVLLREREISAADWIAWRAEGWALATAGAAAMAWAGHAAAAEPWGLAAALADALHIAAAGAWLGALLPLVLLLAAASREAGADARPFAVLAVRRFSTIALAVMLAIVATGLWNAWVQVGSVPALIGTPYGWLLLAKVALLMPILGLAALSRRRLLPALSGEAAAVGRPAMAHLGRFVAWELGLAALILAVTSGLAVTAPARHDAPYWPLSYRLAYDAMADDARGQGQAPHREPDRRPGPGRGRRRPLPEATGRAPAGRGRGGRRRRALGRPAAARRRRLSDDVPALDRPVSGGVDRERDRALRLPTARPAMDEAARGTAPAARGCRGAPRISPRRIPASTPRAISSGGSPTASPPGACPRSAAPSRRRTAGT